MNKQAIIPDLKYIQFTLYEFMTDYYNCNKKVDINLYYQDLIKCLQEFYNAYYNFLKSNTKEEDKEDIFNIIMHSSPYENFYYIEREIKDLLQTINTENEEYNKYHNILMMINKLCLLVNNTFSKI